MRQSANAPSCRRRTIEYGEGTSERLDVIPVQFRVIATKRPKLVCRPCAGPLAQMPAPARLIEGGIPTEALVAHVLVARYADNLPLYRQTQVMARQGVMLDRSTLSFWMGYAAAELAPVVTRLREIMLSSTRLFADETVVFIRVDAPSMGFGMTLAAIAGLVILPMASCRRNHYTPRNRRD